CCQPDAAVDLFVCLVFRSRAIGSLFLYTTLFRSASWYRGLAQPHNLKRTGRAPFFHRPSLEPAQGGLRDRESEALKPVDDATDNRVSVGRQWRGRQQLLDPEGWRRRWTRLASEHYRRRWISQASNFRPGPGRSLCGPIDPGGEMVTPLTQNGFSVANEPGPFYKDASSRAAFQRPEGRKNKASQIGRASTLNSPS